MNKGQKQRLIQAQAYAKAGWRVLPWKRMPDGTKKPLITQWQLNASTQSDVINIWWQENPTAQIGIATGSESGIWVLDIDIKNDKNGIVSLQEHFSVEEIEEMAVWVQSSPSGGVHFFFAWDENNPVKNGTNVGGMQGVDVRGEGGWIGVAPSGYFENDQWKGYVWDKHPADSDHIPQASAKLYELVRKIDKKVVDVDLHQALTTGIPQGMRDDSIFRIACMLERNGIDEDTARVFLEVVGERCNPAFGPIEVGEKIHQAYREYASTKGLTLRKKSAEKALAQLEEQ